MVKQVKGIKAKNRFGYQPIWETGQASRAKRKQRLRGRNLPST